MIFFGILSLVTYSEGEGGGKRVPGFQNKPLDRSANNEAEQSDASDIDFDAN